MCNYLASTIITGGDIYKDLSLNDPILLFAYLWPLFSWWKFWNLFPVWKVALLTNAWIHLIIYLPIYPIFDIHRESDATDEDGSSTRTGKWQLKLSSVGFTGLKRKSEEIESSGKGRCKFFQARKLEQVSHFWRQGQNFQLNFCISS